MSERVPARYLWLAAGFTVWAVAFIVLYTIQGVGCAYDWPLVVHRGALGLALAAHLVLLGTMLAKAPRGQERQFLEAVTLWTLWAALVSTVFTYGPALLVTACV